MLFSESAFLFGFLPILLALYYLAPRAWRNGVLLVASVLFYALGEWRFLPWMGAGVLLHYVAALGIERAKTPRAARSCFLIGIAGGLGMLLWWKYANLLADTLNWAARAQVVKLPPIALPLGISFFTFQMMSYLIDVYRKEVPAQRNPFRLALYIALFPQLIAGPIVRYSDVAEQLVSRVVTREGFAEGVERFTRGMAKKMIVANTMGGVADAVFGVPLPGLSPGLAWLGVFSYTLQIYFDFSGYSDMAIGLGRMFGFRFLENFDHPYVSRSITEFWRRWHMSLSSWYRDYLYIPLGGNRLGPVRTYVNLCVVFLLCGLWHGASWLFVLWGAYHGLLLVLERLGFGKLLSAAPRPLRHAYTLLAVVVGWVLFRAETLPQAGAFLVAMAGLAAGDPRTYPVGQHLTGWYVAVALVGILFSVPLREWLETRSGSRGLSLTGTIVAYAVSILLMAAGTYNPFIYFRF